MKAMLERRKEMNTASEDLEFADECKKLLNYKAHIPMDVTHPDIAKCFKELEVMPFTQESVEKYKAQKLWWANFNVSRLVVSCVVFVLTWSLGGFSLWWFSVIEAAQGKGNGHEFMFLGMICIIGGAIASVVTYMSRAHWVWQREYLADTNIAVPEFALDTALCVKETLGDKCRLHVEQLRAEVYQLDPFLVVEDGNSIFYYLEVWNEPGFNQKRII